MNQSTFTLLIIVFTVISSLITVFATQKLYDRRYKFFNQPSKKFYWFVIFSSLAGFLTIAKDYSNESNLKESKLIADKLAIKNQRINDSLRLASDSIGAAKIAEGTKTTIETFTKSLSVFGLERDSNTNQIRKILIDSLKNNRQIINNYGNDPEIFVSKIQEEPSGNDSLVLKIHMRANQQSALHSQIWILPIVENNFGKLYLCPKNKLLGDITISLNLDCSKNINLAGIGNLNIIHLLITGHYMDQNKKVFNYKDLLTYFRKENIMGNLDEGKRLKLTNFLKDHNIDY